MTRKLVMFDFADTIAKLSPSKEEILQDLISKEIGALIPIAKITEVYHYATNLIFYSSVMIKELEKKEAFYNEFNKNVISLLGLSHLIDHSKIFTYFKEHGQHWELKNEVKDLFSELKDDGYLISLVSNFDTRLYDVLDIMQISSYFDSIFISQEVGLEKPNIDFFNLPLKKHSVEAGNSFFIGDSYFLDYLPSNKLGMNSILLDEKNIYHSIASLVKIDDISGCKNIMALCEIEWVVEF